ncbi:hypothetical protein ACU4GD_19260 [Cupriavidus basilensis]
MLPRNLCPHGAPVRKNNSGVEAGQPPRLVSAPSVTDLATRGADFPKAVSISGIPVRRSIRAARLS